MSKEQHRIAAWQQAAPESNLATGGFPVFIEGRYELRPSLWLDQAHDLLQRFGLRIAGPNPMQREIKPTADSRKDGTEFTAMAHRQRWQRYAGKKLMDTTGWLHTYHVENARSQVSRAGK